MAISCLSFNKSFRVGIAVDDALMPEKTARRLCELIEENIINEKKRMRVC